VEADASQPGTGQESAELAASRFTSNTPFSPSARSLAQTGTFA